MINLKKIGTFSDKADIWLLICSIISALLGVFIINSAAASLDAHLRYVVVQTAAFVIGTIAMTAIIFFNYTYLGKLRYIVFFLGVGLLILVLTIGKLSHGTQGWLVLGPITIQPSEIAKLCFIITISQHISKVKDSINKPKTLIFLFIHFLCYALPVILQPDFGTATVFAVIFVFILVFAGIHKKYIIGFSAILTAASPIVWFLLKDYQKNRITSFLFPENDPTGSGYHILQSKLAIGSGMIWGQGYLKGPQTQYGYLPEKQTDFIYSVLGEEFGLFGCLILTMLLFIIIYRCFDNAKSCSHDTFGELLCVGVGAMMFFHVAENIGMCLGLLPITGIPLPFISYGGSNLVTCFSAIGLVQSVRMRRRATKFDFIE